MSKKHYEWAAAYVARLALAGMKDEGEVWRLADSFAALFAEFSGKFDRSRFKEKIEALIVQGA